MTKKHDEQKTEHKSEEIENLENQVKRSLADYQNLEKRIAEEKSSWIRSANKGLLLKLLPGLDSLILAEKHTQDEGIKLSIKHFLDILEQEGVKRIKTVGENFDPRTMECIETVESEDGKVLSELRSGYTIHNEVLRPAQVRVGQRKFTVTNIPSDVQGEN